MHPTPQKSPANTAGGKILIRTFKPKDSPMKFAPLPKKVHISKTKPGLLQSEHLASGEVNHTDTVKHILLPNKQTSLGEQRVSHASLESVEAPELTPLRRPRLPPETFYQL